MSSTRLRGAKSQLAFPNHAVVTTMLSWLW